MNEDMTKNSEIKSGFYLSPYGDQIIQVIYGMYSWGDRLYLYDEDDYKESQMDAGHFHLFKHWHFLEGSNND